MKKLLYFSAYVNESTEVLNANMRPLNSMEISILKKFKEFISIVWQYSKKRQDIKSFEDEVRPYLKYDFAIEIKKFLDKINSVDTKKLNIPDDIISVHDKEYEKVLKIFKSGKLPDVKKLAELNGQLSIAKRSANTVAQATFRNPYKLEPTMLFSRKNKLLDKFEEADLAKFKEFDLNRPLYTYLNFPKKSLQSFEHILYFISELSDNMKPKRISSDIVKIYSHYLNDDKSEYTEFISKLQNYLYQNNRKDINYILSEINKYPELVKANNMAKKKYTIVYRGIGFYEDDDIPTEKKLIQKDKETVYVATSTDMSVAKRFAEMRGHFDRDRNSDIGYIIKVLSISRF